MTSDARLLAFYLPQYHPIPENDTWWGRGFTEWTNVARAKPLFSWHQQPRVPADLGFYDLRVPEVRQAQADLAREYGIHGFCYYHYWFHGKRLLQRPLDEVLATGAPDFPFCLCWANESWTRTWDGRSKEYLIEQAYSEEDDRNHMRWLAGVFGDPRYIRVQDKPLFLVYRASQLPDPLKTTMVWREEAQKLGVGEIYLCRVESFTDERVDPAQLGFDAAVQFQPDWATMGPRVRWGRWWRYAAKLGFNARAYQEHQVHEYASLVENALAKPLSPYTRFSCVTPRWDNSPRRKHDSVIFRGSTPDLYEHWLRETIRRSATAPSSDSIVFINAWNEWGEGNYLEPDMETGRSYLEATRRALRGQ